MTKRIYNFELKEVILFNDEDDISRDSSSEEFLSFSEYKTLAKMWYHIPKEKEKKKERKKERKKSSQVSLF